MPEVGRLAQPGLEGARPAVPEPVESEPAACAPVVGAKRVALVARASQSVGPQRLVVRESSGGTGSAGRRPPLPVLPPSNDHHISNMPHVWPFSTPWGF